VIAFDQLYMAQLGTHDDSVVGCGFAGNTCRDQLAYVDTLPNGVRWLFFDPGWHVDYPDDPLLLDWLHAADPLFQHLRSAVAVWRRADPQPKGHRGLRRRPLPVGAVPNGGPHSGAFRRNAYFPALAVCLDGHANILDAKRLRVQ
jgi:hypothetical protein